MTMNTDGVGGWIERRARTDGDRVAIVFGDTRLVYADLASRIRRLAHGLRSLGVGKGDRVVWTGPNHPAFLETLFAVAKLGAVLVPIDHRLEQDAIQRLLDEVGACTVRSADCTHEDLIANHRDAPIGEPIDPDDLCLMPFTSGTTGLPKGVMLTHANLTWNAFNGISSLDIHSDDVGLAVTPFCRTGGIGLTVLPVLLRGGTVVIATRPDPDDVLRLIEQRQVTLGFANPDLVQALVRARRWRIADLGGIRAFVVGGAPARERLLQECTERGVPVLEGYGLSEAAPLVAVLDEGNAALKMGSVGRPALFVDIRVVAADSVDRMPGEIGELLVRGPNVMAGYWHRAADSWRVVDAQGWLHTGDAAYIDADGFLFIVGRMEDAYDIAGTTVHPGIAERVLLRHAAVAEACVVGGADGTTAHVVLDPAASADVEAELGALLETLPVHARPTAMKYVASLPKNANGKVLRRRLSPAA
jgi:fatty-acyl-CoA synthase